MEAQPLDGDNSTTLSRPHGLSLDGNWAGRKLGWTEIGLDGSVGDVGLAVSESLEFTGGSQYADGYRNLRTLVAERRIGLDGDRGDRAGSLSTLLVPSKS